MKMNFTDAVQLGDVRATSEGYMVADARVARTGIQSYRGSELGKPASQFIRLYRPDDEVFAADSMASFAFKPVTLHHPKSDVTAVTWKRDSVGFTSGEIARDGGFLRVPMMLADAGAIQSVHEGKRELSVGYTCDIDWTAGITDSGEPYDGRQVAIRANHIAIVPNGRAGHACRLGDEWPNNDPPPTVEDRTMAEPNLRTVLVDGISISVTDQGAQAIDKLQRTISDMTTAAGRRDAEMAALRDAHTAQLNSTTQAKDGEIAGIRATHTSAIEAKDGEIAALKASHTSALAAKDGEIAGLKAKAPTAEQMDTLIADRANIIDAARKILGDKFDPKGKSNADLRRAAVEKRLGAAAITDKSDDYVGAAFDTLTAVGAPSGRDPVRDHFVTPGNKTLLASTKDADDAWEASNERLRNAWRSDKKETV